MAHATGVLLAPEGDISAMSQERAVCYVCARTFPRNGTLPIVGSTSLRVCRGCDDETKRNPAIQVGAAIRNGKQESMQRER